MKAGTPTSRVGSDGIAPRQERSCRRGLQRPPGRRRGVAFTLLELLIVVALLALVLTLALPRFGRLPARLQAEQCVSALRAAMDEAGLRARATGQAVRLTLISDPADDTSRFAVSPINADPLSPFLGGMPAATTADAEQDPSGDGALIPGVNSYPMPAALVWDARTVQDATVPGEDGPTFVFLSTGEAGGPALEFTVRKQRHRLELDPLTGRADIRTVLDR